MKSILFVCLGNICRSPMAEMIMKALLKDSPHEIRIESAATSTYEIGNSPHAGAIKELKKHNIPIVEHYARQITSQDFYDFDYIIGMDNSNITNLKKLVPENKLAEKIFLVTDVLDVPYEVEDPWYDGNFARTYQQLFEVLPLWVNRLKKIINADSNCIWCIKEYDDSLDVNLGGNS